MLCSREWDLSDAFSEPVSSGSSWKPPSDQEQASSTSDGDDLETERELIGSVNLDIVMDSECDSDCNNVEFPALSADLFTH